MLSHAMSCNLLISIIIRLLDTFEKFIREHEIMTDKPDTEGGEEALLEPNSNNDVNLYRVKCYSSLLQRIKNRHHYDTDSSVNSKVFIIEVPLDELIAWDGVRGMDIANRATENTNRYQGLFCTVIDRILGSMEVTDETNNHQDTVDILHEQRLAQQAHRQEELQQQQQNNQNPDEQEGNLAADMSTRQPGVTDEFPPILMRRYELRILPQGRPAKFPPLKFQHRASHSLLDQLDHIHQSGSKKGTAMGGVSLRHIRSQAMGRLVTIRGMIVRASDVKPCCVVATYTCDHCGCEIYQVVQNKREFMPQRICQSEVCRQNGAKDSLHLQSRGSKFEKFQELKIQELPNQVPMGHVPRSMSVHCRGEMTRLATPGDVVTIDGIFLPQRVAESGYGAMKAGLISTTYLEAQNIVLSKKSYDDSMADSLSEEARKKLDDEILKIATGEDPIGKLSSSLAPEIFGHEDIKRALLLQLVSGCTRKLPDGMRIRGDINICLMGDPGVAKSQLLKHVASVAPRGVYTTGKGSSGVGLTAAITKDLATGEMALEGGALVLADQGICAIDEFDKMDESDRTAIHEVMVRIFVEC
jgi:DNA replication licensing factor MCM7